MIALEERNFGGSERQGAVDFFKHRAAIATQQLHTLPVAGHDIETVLHNVPHHLFGRVQLAHFQLGFGDAQQPLQQAMRKTARGRGMKVGGRVR